MMPSPLLLTPLLLTEFQGLAGAALPTAGSVGQTKCSGVLQFGICSELRYKKRSCLEASKNGCSRSLSLEILFPVSAPPPARLLDWALCSTAGFSS